MRKAPSLILVAFLCTASSSLFGAGYIKFDGVDGEFLRDGERGWIELNSVQWNTPLPSATGGAATAKGGPGSVAIRKRVDKASPALMKASTTGQRFSKVVLQEAAGAGAPAYIEVTLENCMISSYSTSAGGDRPMESLSLNFTKVEYRQTQTGGGGSGGGSAASVGGLAAKRPAITKVTPSAASANAGQNVVFVVQATGDCQRARIEFGDGTSGPEFAIVAGKGQPAPAHVYAKGGTFEVKVYGILDPMAHQSAPPPPAPAGKFLCNGHATTTVQVRQSAALAPNVR